MKVFLRLQVGVKNDVEIRNKQRREGDTYVFQTQDYADSFAVWREGNRLTPKTVRFELKGEEIHVRGDNGNPDFVVTLTVDFLGDCRLVVGVQELAEWHVRKMALEDLFFKFPAGY